MCPEPPPLDSWPTWPDAPQQRSNDQLSDFTVGVEEELMLLDPATLGLVPAAGQLLDRAGGDPRYKEELPAAQIEIVTPPCANAEGVHRSLLGARRDLLTHAGGTFRLAGSGTHPFAPTEGALSIGARYTRLADEYQWSARRGLAWGVHVHVALADARRALAVHDALRSHLPELAALAGNSPFHDGADTGLHAVRPKLAEGFPRQGVPPAWGTWDAYAEFLAWGSRAGAFDADGRQLWWEVRLHPTFGTLEVRVCDQPATAAESAALAAVVQALCRKLSLQWLEGRLPVPAQRERIEENRWRALRHGLDGTLLDLLTGEPVPARERLTELLAELEPHAELLGSGTAFATAWAMLQQTGSERQRAIAAERAGDLVHVVEALAGRLEAEVAVPAAGEVAE